MAFSTKNQMLGNLAAQAPIQQSQAMKGAQSAQALQMQQQIGAAGATGAAPTTSQLQQAGGQMAQQRAATALQAQQKTGQQLAQVGQAQLQQQGQENKVQLAQKKMALNKLTRENQNKLAFMDEDLRGKIFDNNLKFDEDDRGRQFLNARQLADYAVLRAKNIQDLKDYEQKVSQATYRRKQVLQTAIAKMQQALEQGHLENKQQLDKDHKLALRQAMANAQKKLQEQQSEAANHAAIFDAVTTGVGIAAAAGVGFATGGAGLAYAPAIIGAVKGAGGVAKSQQAPKKYTR